MAQFEAMQKGCHNAEVRTYKHLMKAPTESIRIPKVCIFFIHKWSCDIGIYRCVHMNYH
ncbi:hypothetical protein COOONC_18896 [Cooperia oncophora]